MNIVFHEDIYIGIKQLSEYLIGTHYVSLDDEYTYTSRDGEETTLYYNNNKLVKKPGYEVIITDIDFVHFEIVDSFLYVNILRDDTDLRFLIAYVQEEEVKNE